MHYLCTLNSQDMSTLPQHKSSLLAASGVCLRRINAAGNEHSPVTYAHQDDYYIFGLVEGGTGCGVIDFKEQRFAAGDMFLIQPGQVHRFLNAESAEGWLLIADSSFVGGAEKCIFDNFSLFASSFRIDARRRNELQQIAALLAGRTGGITERQMVEKAAEINIGEAERQKTGNITFTMERQETAMEKATVRRMVETFIGIVAEAVEAAGMQQTRHSQRHVSLVVSFRRLLAEHLAANRQPSHYASLLNISAVYLNEVVKSVTGMNATSFIKNEVMLRAKRQLVHTDLSIKEIADSLGIDDHAYFSRMFTQATGVSPTMFRQRNHG